MLDDLPREHLRVAEHGVLPRVVDQAGIGQRRQFDRHFAFRGEMLGGPDQTATTDRLTESGRGAAEHVFIRGQRFPQFPRKRVVLIRIADVTIGTQLDPALTRLLGKVIAAAIGRVAFENPTFFRCRESLHPRITLLIHHRLPASVRADSMNPYAIHCSGFRRPRANAGCGPRKRIVAGDNNCTLTPRREPGFSRMASGAASADTGYTVIQTLSGPPTPAQSGRARGYFELEPSMSHDASHGTPVTPPPDRDIPDQFRLLVDQVREYAIFMLDPAGYVMTWNDGARRIKGYSTDEIIGRHFSCFYPPDGSPGEAPGKHIERARVDGQVEYEGWRIRRDGSRFWASVVLTAIHDDTGKLTGFAKVTRDLTARHKAEKERERLLRETDKRLRELRCLHQVAEAIRRDPPFAELLEQIARAIPHALREPEQAWAAIRLDEDAWSPERWPDSGIKLTETIRHAGSDRGEITVAYERFPAGDHDTAFSEEEREMLRSVASAVEETAARQERARELERYAHELESFSYSVSHDLRAPLRALDGFSHALAQKYSDAFDKRGHDYLQRIRNASERMSDLIDALLRLSRISRQPMKWGSVDLSALAREVIQDLRDAEPGRDVTVHCQARLYVRGDAPLLRLVLQNLLGNAWKFSRHAEQPTIEFGRDPHHLDRYYIHDNGVGFDSRYVDRLFGAFQRLHSHAEFEGTGIGSNGSCSAMAAAYGPRVELTGERHSGSSCGRRRPWRSATNVRGKDDPAGGRQRGRRGTRTDGTGRQPDRQPGGRRA